VVTAEQRAIAATADAAKRREVDDADVVAQAWAIMAAIPDPEVPAVSIVELGIVRDIACRDGALIVSVTPTYSGCPATDVIRTSIEQQLQALGMARTRVETVLAPPWTTDWIAPEARAKLRSFGIAPPPATAQRIDVASLRTRKVDSVPCPRCASTRTSLLAQFGSTPCKAQYRCAACLEPFDYFKPF
jgi:ring-1,2-phenylacetyl-CoA epoxidase subunit PaaD